MNRISRLLLALGPLVLALLVGAATAGIPGDAAADAAQARAFYVNTTQDLVLDPQLCLPGRPCTFRSAVEKAMSFKAAVRACFEGGCPPGQLPLAVDDPNYDATTGRWTMRFNVKLQSLVVWGDGIDVDFSTNVPGWSGPADNVITVSSGITKTNHMMMIEGSENKFAGFDIDGNFEDAAMIFRNGAKGNQVGPGIVMAGFPEGRGIRILDAGTTGNKIVGIWCGFRADAEKRPVPDGLVDDCIHVAEGASDNFIGGPTDGERNVLSASQLGFGVSVHDAATRNNTIQGNYIGIDPAGSVAAGNQSGIGIFAEATNTKIVGNVISGNSNFGIFATDASTQFGRTATRVENNLIGLDASGKKAIPNGTYGVQLSGLSKDVTVARNRIMYNRTGGVLVCDQQTKNNTITENVITANGGTGIKVCEGANNGVVPPVIEAADLSSVSGRACPNCRVEVFSDPAEEAEVFEGAVTADADGRFSFRAPSGAFSYRNITTTATDGASTSGLSKVKVVSRPSPTPTMRPGRTATPTPSRTPTKIAQQYVYVPVVSNGAER